MKEFTKYKISTKYKIYDVYTDIGADKDEEELMRDMLIASGKNIGYYTNSFTGCYVVSDIGEFNAFDISKDMLYLMNLSDYRDMTIKEVMGESCSDYYPFNQI
jgi:hypothetical protein